jgi:D-glycero-D-manno-heptose 1,7-bisphosphate phosphatase
MIVISNQAAVGNGLMTVARIEEITMRMQQLLRADGTTLAAAYYCIHRREENCRCRKPKVDSMMADARRGSSPSCSLPRSTR